MHKSDTALIVHLNIHAIAFRDIWPISNTRFPEEQRAEKVPLCPWPGRFASFVRSPPFSRRGKPMEMPSLSRGELTLPTPISDWKGHHPLFHPLLSFHSLFRLYRRSVLRSVQPPHPLRITVRSENECNEPSSPLLSPFESKQERPRSLNDTYLI